MLTTVDPNEQAGSRKDIWLNQTKEYRDGDQSFLLEFYLIFVLGGSIMQRSASILIYRVELSPFRYQCSDNVFSTCRRCNVKRGPCSLEITHYINKGSHFEFPDSTSNNFPCHTPFFLLFNEGQYLKLKQFQICTPQ